MKLYLVTQGNIRRWFSCDIEARKYANDRFDTETDGIPFLETCKVLTTADMVALLNEEASREVLR